MKADFSNLDQLFEAIIVVNTSNEVIYYNHHFSIFSKLSPRKLKKISIISDLFVSLDDKINISEIIKDSHDSQKTSVSMEGEIKFPDSNEVTNVVIKAIPSSEYSILCFNDLSIEKSLFQKYKSQVAELKDSYKQLVHADKLKSIGELTAGISHEISNPLTIASGSTELLEIFLETGMIEDNMEEVTDAIANIQSSLLRINKITLNMKKFVYQDDERKEYVDLSSVINSSIALIAPQYGQSDMELSFTDLSDGAIGFVNDLGIEQVLVNLLKNSLDALSGVSSGKVVVELDSSKDGESLFIRVKDNGGGIDSSIENDVFSPFFTTKEIGEGTGMGLSLSKQIIEAHQGNLTYANSDEGMCTFTIELPGVELSSYLDNESQISNLEGSAELKVLIIDNEVSVLNLMASLFKDESISIIGSSRPTEALKLLGKIDVDLVVADYNMPEMNASELSKLIREDHKDLPIVYLTSKEFSNKFNEDKKKYNVSSLVLKPFTKQSIFDAIVKATGGQSEDL